MAKTITEILSALHKPLAFGARQEGQNYKHIKNFSAVVHQLLAEAQALELGSGERLLIENLSLEFRQFEQQSEEEKRQRIQRALGQLEAVIPGADLSGALALQEPITHLKGVGKALAQKLSRKNVRTVEDALLDLPLRYEDRTQLAPIGKARAGQHATIRGKVISAQVAPSFRLRKVLTVLVQDDSGFLIAKWFHYPGKVPDRRFRPGNELILSGAVTVYRGKLEMHHPEVELLTAEEAAKGAIPLLAEERIIPVYALTEGLNQRFYRALQRRVALHYARFLPDCLPPRIRSRFAFPGLSESILRVHCPEKDTELDLLNRHRSPAQKRIIFEELFFLALSIELRKSKHTHAPAFPMPEPKDPERRLTLKLENALAFSLTRAQRRVIQQIHDDMAQAFAMNRLLQGDVGSGKTVVALLAALRAIENGFQVAVMAPTEILAEQHAFNWRQILKSLEVESFCLTSSTARALRKEVLPAIASGQVQILFGTHALLEEEVQFKALGLVVIDEQHRFGVLQRVALRKKGINPHALVMTATPIPRTLAMTVHGDLELSILDELPPGRVPIRTVIFHERNRERLYQGIAREVKKGNQAYVVYPLIEESETLDLKNAVAGFENLKTHIFPNYAVALLHGRMKAQEKEEVMGCFKKGEVQILVSTTVIEVGIDVPQATLMVIENAERFGLSQLHQLRGRIGRSTRASICILVPSFKRTLEARQRLKIMTETQDGFRIAEEDLRIRGPGEVLGTRQAGLPIFCYAELRRDQEIFDQAVNTAREILAHDPRLEKSEHQGLRQALSHKWRGRLQLSRIG